MHPRKLNFSFWIVRLSWDVLKKYHSECSEKLFFIGDFSCFHAKLLCSCVVLLLRIASLAFRFWIRARWFSWGSHRAGSCNNNIVSSFKYLIILILSFEIIFEFRDIEICIKWLRYHLTNHTQRNLFWILVIHTKLLL